MRIRNISNVHINKKIWRELCSFFGLVDILPGYLKDDLGMYPHKYLNISIRERKKLLIDEDGQVVTGSYTYGHIYLYPCKKCNFASLTHVLIHELYHCWLHQNYPMFYDRVEHCSVADNIADIIFCWIGGRIGSSCSSYRLKYSIDSDIRTKSQKLLKKSLKNLSKSYNKNQ